MGSRGLQPTQERGDRPPRRCPRGHCAPERPTLAVPRPGNGGVGPGTVPLGSAATVGNDTHTDGVRQSPGLDEAQASADIRLQPWACRAERGRPRGQRPAGTQLHGAKLNWPPRMSTASLRPGSPPPASRRTGSDAAAGPHPDSCVSARAPAIPSSAQSGPCARGVGACCWPGSEWGSGPCSPLWALTPSRTMCLPQNIPSAPTNTLLCFKNRTI